MKFFYSQKNNIKIKTKPRNKYILSKGLKNDIPRGNYQRKNYIYSLSSPSKKFRKDIKYITQKKLRKKTVIL